MNTNKKIQRKKDIQVIVVEYNKSNLELMAKGTLIATKNISKTQKEVLLIQLY